MSHSSSVISTSRKKSSYLSLGTSDVSSTILYSALDRLSFMNIIILVMVSNVNKLKLERQSPGASWRHHDTLEIEYTLAGSSTHGGPGGPVLVRPGECMQAANFPLACRCDRGNSRA